MTLYQFLKWLLAARHQDGQPVSLYDRAPLHAALDKLRGSLHRPGFVEALRFDWDGQAPRCRELDALLDGAAVSGIVSETYDLWWSQLARQDIETQRSFWRYYDITKS